MKKIFVSAYSLILIFYAATARAIYNPSNLFVGNLGDNSFQGIIMFIIQNIFLPIVGLVSILFIIIGGFQYITSRGNEEQAEASKKTLTNAIIGLVIVILSYIIVVVVINALRP